MPARPCPVSNNLRKISFAFSVSFSWRKAAPSKYEAAGSSCRLRTLLNDVTALSYRFFAIQTLTLHIPGASVFRICNQNVSDHGKRFIQVLTAQVRERKIGSCRERILEVKGTTVGLDRRRD